VEINVDGWNLEGPLILLRICHGQLQVIPKRISLEFLA
jgi:hypothetical protein